MKKTSQYARSSGRQPDASSPGATGSGSAATGTASAKSAHLSAARDPFKPRNSDVILAILVPSSIYSYCWKRAALPISALHNYAYLFLVTGVWYMVVSVPWSLMDAIATHQNIDLERRDELVHKPMRSVWPWLRFVEWSFLLPYLLQVALAIKAWWRARRITALAVAQAEERPSPNIDVERQLFTAPDNIPASSFLNDLVGMRLKESEVDLAGALRPPGPQDVGGAEELEGGLAIYMPPLMASWFGPARPLNIFMAGASSIFTFQALSYLIVLLLGWPLCFIYLWSKGDPTSGTTGVYREAFLGGLWCFFLYYGLPSAVFIGLPLICYRYSKQNGVLMQMTSPF